jgi:hypothetical protein
MLKTTDFLLNFRVWLNKLKIPGVLYFNWTACFPLPDKKINIVVGKKL